MTAIPSPSAKPQSLDLAALTYALDEGEMETNDPTLLTEIDALRQQILPIALTQRQFSNKVIEIPRDIELRLQVLFEALEAVADRNAKQARPLANRLREDLKTASSDPDPDDLSYLQSAAGDAQYRSRGLFQDLMQGELTQAHVEENAARAGREAEEIKRLRQNLKQPPKPKKPPIVHGENMN